MQYSGISPNPISKAKLTTGHSAFRPARAGRGSPPAKIRKGGGAAPLTISSMPRSEPRVLLLGFFFGGNSIMNLIYQKINQKERATLAVALVALDCDLSREELLRALLHLAFPRIGIRGVDLGEDSEWELFENPLATTLIDPAIVMRRAPPHLANFHRRDLRLLASLPLGLRAAEEIVNAIVVSRGKDAAHHDIEVAVSANEDEAHTCLACFLANARALLL